MSALRRLRSRNISMRLGAAFALIIAVIVAMAVNTNASLSRVDQMHHYNLQFALTRRHYVHTFYGEFLRYRHDLLSTFLNDEWRRQAAPDEKRRSALAATESAGRQAGYASTYLRLVFEDPHISPALERRVTGYMLEISESADAIAELVSSLFFGGAPDSGGIPDGAAEALDFHMNVVVSGLETLIGMAGETVREVLGITDGIIADTRNITFAIAVAGILVAMGLAYFSVASFTSRIKDIERRVRQIRLGDFGAAGKSGDGNEITGLIYGMVDVFTELIAEINNVAGASAQGNLSARIPAERFEGGYREAAEAINQLMKNVKSAQDNATVVEESSLAKSRFLARISHEIRTPLTAVLGIAEIELQNTDMPLHQEEAFAKIHNAAGMLMSLVNDILDLSRIEAGKMIIVNSPYDVEGLIIDVVQLHLVYLGSKKVDFKVIADESLPAVLVGDNVRVRQIIYNLLSNAFKYTEAGHVDLHLLREDNPAKPDAMHFVIRISDSGHGMSQEQVELLHKEYVRFLEHRDRDTVGSGLGMPIVYSLLQLLDASIDIESDVGRGTTITVRIPQGIGSPATLGPEAANLTNLNNLASSIIKKTKLDPEPMPYGRVLVVDDVETNLYVAKGLLMFYDLQIDTCENGLEAIRMVQGGKEYDIIFMDHMMPEMNGLEATQALRGMGYTKPIVALTANALIGQAEVFLQSGFDSFLSKPIQTVHLNATLMKYVRDVQPPHVIEAARAAQSEARGDIEGYLDKEIAILRRDFVKSQTVAALEIRRAIGAGDMETAARLAHTSKGLAGLIREGRLSLAAEKVERGLKEGGASASGQAEFLTDLDEFEAELARVLSKLSELGMKDRARRRAGSRHAMPKEKMAALLAGLEEQLADFDASCTVRAEKLAKIPEARVLAHQIEEYEFEAALATLKSLKKVMEL